MDQYHIHLDKPADNLPADKPGRTRAVMMPGRNTSPPNLTALPRSRGKLDPSTETHPRLLKVCVCVREAKRENGNDIAIQTSGVLRGDVVLAEVTVVVVEVTDMAL